MLAAKGVLWLPNKFKWGGKFFWKPCTNQLSKWSRSAGLKPNVWHINSTGVLLDLKICSSSLNLLSHLIGLLPMMLPFFSTRTCTIAVVSVKLSGIVILSKYGFLRFKLLISCNSPCLSMEIFTISSFCSGWVRMMKTLFCPWRIFFGVTEKQDFSWAITELCCFQIFDRIAMAWLRNSLVKVWSWSWPTDWRCHWW